MKLIRPIVIGVILVNLALMAVAGPIKGTLLRYEVARKQREIRDETLKQRSLLWEVSIARRPDQVAEVADGMGFAVVPLQEDGR